MTIEQHAQFQQAWDNACRAKGYKRRGGMETRFTDDGFMYYLLPGYGRVLYDGKLGGWIAVVSVQGWNEDVYQYVRLDTALITAPQASVTTQVHS